MFSSNTSAANGAANYIEDVFSTYLYTGNGSTQTITNGIDLSGKGGLVWTKCRNNAANNALFDTARGTTKYLSSNLTNAQATEANGITAFGTTGYTFGNNYDLNESTFTYASWTFRKQPKFFDVVTYTGNGTSGRAISHSLGSTPGCIIIKRTNTTGNWATWHRSLTSLNYGLYLNTTDAEMFQGWFSNVDSTSFTISGSSDVNANGSTYVAYIYAHNAGGFGLTGTDNVISCGSFAHDSASGSTVTLGYEPQFLLVKRTDSTSNWFMLDVMRGQPTRTGVDAVQRLAANLSDAEVTTNIAYPTSTGFYCDGAGALVNGATYIYIAIRRGPMKVPTDATKVFNADTLGSTGDGQLPGFRSSFPVDLNLALGRGAGGVRNWGDRLRGNVYLASNSTAAEASNGYFTFDYMNGAYNSTSTLSSLLGYMFRRAPSFFDEVCYEGDSGAGRAINHNLSAVPELMIVKRRSTSGSWPVYSAALGNTGVLFLNLTNANSGPDSQWNSTTPTSSVFTVGSGNEVNGAGITYVSYLFATCAGVSKVGSYTGTGTTLQVNCGFTAGARFVLIKRTDSTGSWYVWDVARGISSGNDPYLLLNSTAAEVTNTDYIDAYSAGFEISSTAPAEINASGGTFIYLSIA